MNNKDYVTLVNAGNFPEDIKVPIDPPFSDERGDITNLWLGNSGSVTLITSKAGSKRANHHHVNDWHSSYVVSGSIIYTEADVDKSTPLALTIGVSSGILKIDSANLGDL